LSLINNSNCHIPAASGAFLINLIVYPGNYLYTMIFYALDESEKILSNLILVVDKKIVIFATKIGIYNFYKLFIIASANI
jgi:hypothetical protein